MDLADRLNIMEPFALGVLEAFWHWVAKYHPDGDLSTVRPSLMARAMRYRDDADALMEALLAARWIDRATMYVHDWHEHSDDSVDNALARSGRRYANGAIPRMKRMDLKERKRIIAEFFPDDGARKTTESASCGDSCAQNPTEDNSVATACAREAHEKPLPVASSQKPVAIASSQKPEPSKTSCAEASSAPPLGTLPCLGGKSWPFTQADVLAWEEAYPAIDVIAELRKDREWLKANPRNMKTPGGMRRHVNGWLAKAQNESKRDPEQKNRGMPQPGYDPTRSTQGFEEDQFDKWRAKRDAGIPLSPIILDKLREMDTYAGGAGGTA